MLTSIRATAFIPIIFVVFASNACLAGGDELRAAIVGRTWRCTGAESQGKADPIEEGAIVTFTDETVIWKSSSGERLEFAYRLSEMESPVAIDWCYDRKDTPLEMKGIIKSDGRSLQICGRLGFKGDPIARPKQFATKKGDDSLRMIIFTVVDDE